MRGKRSFKIRHGHQISVPASRAAQQMILQGNPVEDITFCIRPSCSSKERDRSHDARSCIMFSKKAVDIPFWCRETFCIATVSCRKGNAEDVIRKFAIFWQIVHSLSHSARMARMNAMPIVI